MKVIFNVEYELTKEVHYHLDSNEPIEEYTFVVPGEWLHDVYKNYIVDKFDYQDVPIDEFLDCYVPEEEGMAIYILANSQGVIIEEGWAEITEY